MRAPDGTFISNPQSSTLHPSFGATFSNVFGALLSSNVRCCYSSDYGFRACMHRSKPKTQAESGVGASLAVIRNRHTKQHCTDKAGCTILYLIIYIYICTYLYICVHLLKETCTHVYIYIYIYTRMYVCVHIHNCCDVAPRVQYISSYGFINI